MKKFKCNIAFLSVLTAVLSSCLSYVDIIDKEDPNFSYWTNLSICCLEGSTYRFSAALTNTQDRVSEYGFCYQSESDSVEYVVAENSVENIYTADVTIEKNYGKTYNVDFVMHNGLGDKRSIASSEFTVNPLSSFVQFDSIITLSYDRQSKEAIVELACAVDEIVDVSAWGITYGKSQDLTQNITTIESTGDFNGKISATIPECLPGEVYYIRPYVKDGESIAEGSTNKLSVKALPLVSTSEVTEIKCFSALSGGVIVDVGGEDNIVAKGLVYGESSDLTIHSAMYVESGEGSDPFGMVIPSLKHGTRYYVRAFATNSVGTSYGEAKEFVTEDLDLSRVQDLSVSETANCYVVSESGLYKFLPMKGNSKESVGEVYSVEVLWESFGTSSPLSPGDLLACSPVICDGAIIFKTAETFFEGNAVIAARNSSGTILWSWHIWLTDSPIEIVYANGAGIMMDRNIGATAVEMYDRCSYGLIYQWGRKDPFLGSLRFLWDGYQEYSTMVWTAAVESSSITGTIDYTIANPTTFIEHNTYNGDWYYTGTSSTDNTRWLSSKTIYDPCPPGWRVPDNSVWINSGLENAEDKVSVRGLSVLWPYATPSTWYPATQYFFRRASSWVERHYSGYYASVDGGMCIGYSYDDFDSGVYSDPHKYFNVVAHEGGFWQEYSVRCYKIDADGSDLSSSTEGLGNSEYEW